MIKRRQILVASMGTASAELMPVIVSAIRSTDIPAFYADWFMECPKAGYKSYGIIYAEVVG